MIELFTAATPNGHKVSIALEELALPYDMRVIDFASGEQREPWFLQINPNGRIPVMPADSKGRSLVLQWLMFQMGGVGPMMGQANIFFRYFPEKIQPAIDRYHAEVKRLFTVLDGHLAGNEFLAGDYSIADIANWAWVRTAKWSGVPFDDLPHLTRWVNQIRQRPAVQAGILMPPSKLSGAEADTEKARKFVEEARKIVVTGGPDLDSE